MGRKDRTREDLQQADRYFDLEKKHRKRMKGILSAARVADNAKDLRDKSKISTILFPLYRSWLEKRGHLRHEKVSSGGRPVKKPAPTEKGRSLLLTVVSPPLDSLAFEVDGGQRGKIKVEKMGGKELNADQVASMMNLLGSGKCLTVGGPQLHANRLDEPLVLKYDMEWAEGGVVRLERAMWRLVKNVLETVSPKTGKAEIEDELPEPPAYWLPPGLGSTPSSRYLVDIYNEYWHNRIKREQDEITLIPQTPEEASLTGYLFSVEGQTAKGMLRDMELGNAPPEWLNARLEDKELRTISEDADFHKVSGLVREIQEFGDMYISPSTAPMRRETSWEIHDPEPVYKIVKEEGERLDVYDADGPSPENGWKLRRDILREISELAKKNEGCQRWLKDRLEREPNFFMPAPLWREIGYNVEHEGNGRVSLPYNTEPSEPKFHEVLTTGLVYLIDELAEECGKNPILSFVLSSGIFSEFVGSLEELQGREKFYSLWPILRERPVITGRRGEEVKDLKVFEPVDEAVLRFHYEEKPIELSRAYSDLKRERKNTIEELKKAVKDGEYDL